MLKNTIVSLLKKLGLYGVANYILYRLSVRWAATPWGHARRMRTVMAFYSRFIKEGDLSFDVGANVGERTEAFRRLGSNVVAIEPQDICVQKLVSRYGRNNSTVRIIQKALGAKEGEAEMMLSDAHWISSLSAVFVDAAKGANLTGGYDWHTKVIVPVTTLDKLIEEYGQPAFCKIDVEGFEPEVLKGLSHQVPAISIEFHTVLIDSAIECVNRLSSLGMIWYNYSVAEAMVLSLEGWVKVNDMCDVLRTLPDKMGVGGYGDVYATTSLQQPRSFRALRNRG